MRGNFTCAIPRQTPNSYLPFIHVLIDSHLEAVTKSLLDAQNLLLEISAHQYIDTLLFLLITEIAVHKTLNTSQHLTEFSGKTLFAFFENA